MNKPSTDGKLNKKEIDELFKRYSELQGEILEINDELRRIEEMLKHNTGRFENLEGCGFVTGWKWGRKKYFYEEAVKNANAPQFLINQHTKTRIDWRTIAKKLDLPLDDYLEQGPPVFSVKVDM